MKLFCCSIITCFDCEGDVSSSRCFHGSGTFSRRGGCFTEEKVFLVVVEEVVGLVVVEKVVVLVVVEDVVDLVVVVVLSASDCRKNIEAPFY